MPSIRHLRTRARSFFFRLRELHPNTLRSYYQRSKWRWSPSLWFADLNRCEIDRPIFFLGVQGGGLTLIARVLKRNNDVVTLSGNRKYWTGSDEMQSFVFSRLSPDFWGPLKANTLDLRFMNRKVKRDDPPYGGSHNWLYASDELLAEYRRTERDYTEMKSTAFKNAIRRMISVHRASRRPRFLDKSQVFSLKLPLLHKILEPHDPKYIVVLRNPYVACVKAVTKWIAWIDRPIEWKFATAAAHYDNTFRTLMQDIERLGVDAHIVRFEDFLRSPRTCAQHICAYAELGFEEDMLPQPYHRLPFGTPFGDNKWYPLRDTLSEDQAFLEHNRGHLDIIKERCGWAADRWGYNHDAQRHLID